MEFSRPEYWSGQPFPSPGDHPNPGMEPRSPTSQVDSLPSEPPGEPTGKPNRNIMFQGLLFFFFFLKQDKFITYSSMDQNRDWVLQAKINMVPEPCSS